MRLHILGSHFKTPFRAGGKGCSDLISKYLLIAWALSSLVPAATLWAAPAGQVQLEIAGDNQLGAGLSFQQWGQALSAAGVQNFRLRAGQEGEKPAIEVGGTEQMPFYKVTAVLGGRDELIVPGARFRRSECKKLAAWLDDLAKRGPPEKREKLSAFGLTASQLQKVNADLAKTVGFSTKGMTRSEAVDKIAARLGLRAEDRKCRSRRRRQDRGRAFRFFQRHGPGLHPASDRFQHGAPRVGRDALVRGEKGPARSGALAGRLARREPAEGPAGLV